METIITNINGLPLSIIEFIIFGLVIALAGTLLTKISDKLADITGLGEALFGAIFVGLSTSLPGTITSITTAYNVYAKLAVSNALGGIILQIAFLAVADIIYQKANLEHAAASLANMIQSVVLIISLCIVLIAMFVPGYTFFAISPASIALFVVNIVGFKIVANSQKKPMWKPTKTVETVVDENDYGSQSKKLRNKLWLQFFCLTILVSIAGYFIGKAAIVIVNKTPLSQSIVGGFFTAFTSSLPELIISIVAVREGALTLAVGNIIGGSAFDILCLALSDFAYRKGSIYIASGVTEIFMVTISILLTAILTLGLLYRQRKGPVKIGWESVLILTIAVFSYILIFRGL